MHGRDEIVYRLSGGKRTGENTACDRPGWQYIINIDFS
jgi:hypothetical protein